MRLKYRQTYRQTRPRRRWRVEADPPGLEHNEGVNSYISKADKVWWEEYAQQHQTSVSALLRQVIHDSRVKTEARDLRLAVR